MEKSNIISTTKATKNAKGTRTLKLNEQDHLTAKAQRT